MREKIQVSGKSVTNALVNVAPEKAVAELIWNGADARASEISVSWELTPLGAVDSLTIRDNGVGIPSVAAFKQFLFSEKSRLGIPALEDRRGVGRLMFYKVAPIATWTSVFVENEQKRKLSITIRRESLDEFQSEAPSATDDAIGTTVTLRNCDSDYAFDGKVFQSVLRKEFGVLVFKTGLRLIVGGEQVTPDIEHQETKDFEIDGYDFAVTFVKWRDRSSEEYSRVYWVDHDDREAFNKTTTYNNKGDGFLHSVVVRSKFFSGVTAEPKPANGELFPSASSGLWPTYKQVSQRVDDLLVEFRKPFLDKGANNLIDDIEKSGALKANGDLDDLNIAATKSAIKTIYKAEPKIWTKLNDLQQNLMANLVRQIVSAGDFDKLTSIVGDVVQLDENARAKLFEALRISSLSDIIRTVTFLHDRLQAINDLKALVFKPEFGAV